MSICHSAAPVRFYFGNPWRSVAFVGKYFEDLVFNLRPIEGINDCVFLQLRLIEYFNRGVIVKLHPIEHFNEGVIVNLRLIEHLNGYVFTKWVVKMVSNGGEWVIGVRKMFYGMGE
jgi:hypothetical protein